jgi:Protein of unknown function (DUF3349)
VTRFLTAIINWLRAGYPNGVPPTDYIPVLALLSRRLTTDEVKAVAAEVMRHPTSTTSTSGWRSAR